MTTTTTDVVDAYYTSWQAGIGAFDETSLRRVLAADLLFEGPIAGTRTGVEPFLRGLADFARGVRGMRMLHQVRSADAVASLYECDLGATGGTLRFAEFMRVVDGRITSIRLVYDPHEFRRLMA